MLNKFYSFFPGMFVIQSECHLKPPVNVQSIKITVCLLLHHAVLIFTFPVMHTQTSPIVFACHPVTYHTPLHTLCSQSNLTSCCKFCETRFVADFLGYSEAEVSWRGHQGEKNMLHFISNMF